MGIISWAAVSWRKEGTEMWSILQIYFNQGSSYPKDIDRFLVFCSAFCHSNIASPYLHLCAGKQSLIQITADFNLQTWINYCHAEVLLFNCFLSKSYCILPSTTGHNFKSTDLKCGVTCEGEMCPDAIPQTFHINAIDLSLLRGYSRLLNPCAP